MNTCTINVINDVINEVESSVGKEFIDACANGDLERVVRIPRILSWCGDFKSVNKGLMKAIFNNHQKIVEYIIRCVSLGVKIKDVFNYACYCRYLGIIKLFIKYCYEDLNICQAINCTFKGDYYDEIDNKMIIGIFPPEKSRSSRLKVVKFLVKKYENDINVLDSALLSACNYNNIALLKLLLKRNYNKINESIIDINNVDVLNDCFYFACRRGNIKIAKLLVKYGVTDWLNGLKNAFEERHINIIKFIVNKGKTNINNWLFNYYDYNWLFNYDDHSNHNFSRLTHDDRIYALLKIGININIFIGCKDIKNLFKKINNRQKKILQYCF